MLNKNGGVAGFTSWMGFTSWQGTGAPSSRGVFRAQQRPRQHAHRARRHEALVTRLAHVPEKMEPVPRGFAQ